MNDSLKDKIMRLETPNLTTTSALGYTVPTRQQLNAAADLLGMTGTEIAEHMGISARQWRHYLLGDRYMPFAEWALIRSWLERAKPKE